MRAPRVPVYQQVADLLTANRGADFCDYCIQRHLELRDRRQAQQATSAVGTSQEYRRRYGNCSDSNHQGNQNKLVIRRR
jgi:hypothetical protein